MKKLIGILSIAVLFTIGTVSAHSINTIEPVVKRAKQITDFNGVSVGGAVKAFVTIGDKEHVRLEGDKEAIAELVIEVKNGVLTIRPKSMRGQWGKKFKNPQINAYITAKRISQLSVSGSGSIEVENAFTTNDLALAISGSGNIKVQVNAKEVAAAISGSGNMNIGGKATQLSASIDGSGNISAGNLTVSQLSAQISGSGNIDITATKNIAASISGSGSINYSGDPAVTKSISGSGRVRKS